MPVPQANSNRQRYFFLAGLVVVLLIPLFVLIIGLRERSETADLRNMICSAVPLCKDAELLSINFPPRPNCYPGSLLSAAGVLLNNAVEENDVDLKFGDVINVDIEDEVTVKGNSSLLSSMFGGTLGTNDEVSVKITIESLRTVEMAGGEIRQRVLANQRALELAKADKDVHVIVRAYLGQLTVELTSGASMDGLSESSIGDFELEARSTSDRNRSRRFVSKGSVIFAFETMSVKYTLEHLAPTDKPDNVQLTPSPPPLRSPWIEAKTGQERADSTAELFKTTKPPIAMITLSVGHYCDVPLLSQSWQEVSASTVRQAMRAFGASDSTTFSLAGAAGSPLTRQHILDFIQRATNKASQEGCPIIVCYIIGHTVVTDKSDILLLTGTTSVESLSGQIGNLEESEDVVRLEEIYSVLVASETPITLLVDGCMAESEAKAFRALGEWYQAERDASSLALTDFMTPEEVELETRGMSGEEIRQYIEDWDADLQEMRRLESEVTRDTAVTDEMIDDETGWLFGDTKSGFLDRLNWAVSKAIVMDLAKQFVGPRRYLASSHPVVLGAFPGTYAESAVNPFDNRSRLGPLALLLTRKVRAAQRESCLVGYGDFIRSIVENHMSDKCQTDELPRGTTSWSDLSEFVSTTGNSPFLQLGLPIVEYSGPILTQAELERQEERRREQEQMDRWQSKIRLDIDGRMADWSDGQDISSEVGKANVYPEFGVDVARCLMLCDEDNLYVFLETRQEIDQVFEDSGQSSRIADIYFDTDLNGGTGDTPFFAKSQKLPIGFEYKCSVVLGILAEATSGRNSPYVSIKLEGVRKPGSSRELFSQSTADASPFVAYGEDGIEVVIPRTLIRLGNVSKMRVHIEDDFQFDEAIVALP